MSKKKLIPELRFPEFKNEGEWEVKTLGEVLKFQTGFPFDSVGFNEEKNGVRLIRNRDLKSDDKIIYYSKSFDEKYIVRNGDILVGMDGDFTPCVWSKGEALLNQRVGRILVNVKNNHRFFFYVLTIYLKIVEDLTAKTTVKHLSHSDVEKISALVPSLKEQQKIASCLSSLDEVIETHSQKLELLKDHKKGLMQNLFPQEGEKVPKLRFKEFEKDGEWVEKSFGEVCINIASGKDKNEDNGEYELFGSTGIIGKTNNASYKGDYILVARVGANAGFLNRVNSKFGVTDNTLVISLEKNQSVDFIYYALENFGLNKLIFGSGQPLITGGQLKNLDLSFPTLAEQQKIASCLSALDELITAQAEKIEQLKQHKKGLMQGLFPKSITN